MGLPPVIVYLELVPCAMCRCLIQEGASSNPFEPSHSIVQGLRPGTIFARIMTYFTLNIVATLSPHTGHRVWIDDISQAITGSTKPVRQSLIKAIVDTGKALARRKLKISPKS
eukprot:4800132-Pyramimonas_sp.AAC.1